MKVCLRRLEQESKREMVEAAAATAATPAATSAATTGSLISHLLFGLCIKEIQKKRHFRSIQPYLAALHTDSGCDGGGRSSTFILHLHPQRPER